MLSVFVFLLNSCTLRKKLFSSVFQNSLYLRYRHEHARQDFKAPVAGGRHLPGDGRGGPPRRLGSAGGQGPGKFYDTAANSVRNPQKKLFAKNVCKM